MEMSCTPRLEIRVEVHSEWFQTIFPLTEALLNKSKYQKAVCKLDPDGDRGDYRSLMDYLACSTFDWLIPHCEAFYEGNGKLLKDVLDEQTIKAYDTVMSKIVLPHALKGVKVKL